MAQVVGVLRAAPLQAGVATMTLRVAAAMTVLAQDPAAAIRAAGMMSPQGATDGIWPQGLGGQRRCQSLGESGVGFRGGVWKGVVRRMMFTAHRYHVHDIRAMRY